MACIWYRQRMFTCSIGDDDPSVEEALLYGAADIFERGGKKPAMEVDEETVRSLHAKIGELAVANDFLSRKLKPWTGK